MSWSAVHAGGSGAKTVARQFGAEAKAKAVLRVLGGVNSGSVAEGLEVSRRRLERWQKDFVAAGQEALQGPGGSRLRQRIRRWGQAVAPYAVLVPVLALTVLVLTRFVESDS